MCRIGTVFAETVTYSDHSIATLYAYNVINIIMAATYSLWDHSNS